MPTTKIADVIVPEIFNPYVINRVTDKSALVRSGIIATNPELDALASAGGKIIHMPHWNDLGGESQVLSDTVPLNVDKITTGQDQARLHMRGNAWGANDLAGALAGSDPMKAIGELVSDFWVRDEQRILIASLKGVFSAANMTGNIYDPSAATDGSELFSSKGFLTAQFKLGDAYDALTAIAVHSMTYAAMLEKDMIEFIPDSQGKPIAKYRGLDIVVDDNMPVVGGVYTSYLFGRGAFGYATQVSIYVEVDITTNAGFPINGITLVKDEIVRLIGGTASDGTIYVGSQMGEDVIVSQLTRAVFNITGIDDAKVRVGTAAGSLGTANLVIVDNQVAQTDTSKVTVI